MAIRILASSDLHYNMPRSQKPVRALAKEVVARGGHVLVLAGDIAGPDLREFDAALALFEGFDGIKLFVAGNHDLWVTDGRNSYAKWAQDLPAAAGRRGFVMLDHQPVQVGHVAFVGSVGWYDYSFRRTELNVPLRFYRAKVGPGRAAAMAEWRALMDGAEELDQSHYAITTAWRDGVFVKLPFTDEAFTHQLAGRLAEQVRRVSATAAMVVAVLHHLPRRDLVWYRDDPGWDFAAAFLGSERFGEVLDACRAVRLCLSGHSHRADFTRENGCRYVSIGSTYSDKALLEFDL